MDKIKNISLGGFSFIFEDAAYSALSSYLAEVRKHLSKNEDANEILFDIEQRMAELLKNRITNHDTVVIHDVQYLIETLGNPDQYTDDEPATNESASEAAPQGTPSYSNLKKKKLYRNPDDKKIGGVLSGLSYYLNTDVTMLRILYVLPLLLMLFVSTIVVYNGRYFVFPVMLFTALYIIFWAIVPTAITTAEKLEMKGEAVNLDTISNFKNNPTTHTTEWMRSATDKRLFGVIGGFAAYSKLDSTWLRIGYLLFTVAFIPMYIGVTIFSVAAYLLLTLILKKEQPFQSTSPLTPDPLVPRRKGNLFFFLLKGFFIFIGVLLCIPLFALLVGLIISIFAGSVIGGFSVLAFSDYLPYLASEAWQLNWFYFSITLLLLLPVSLIVLLSLKLFSKPFSTPRVWIVANVLCLVIGFLGLLVSAGSVGRDFISYHEENQIIPITTPADTLYITENYNDYHQYLNLDTNRLVVKATRLTSVRPTAKKEPYLLINRESRGYNIGDAKQQLQHLVVPLQISNNHITIPDYFEIKKGNTFRGQRVFFTLFVPEGKYVHQNTTYPYRTQTELYKVTKDSLQLILSNP